MWYREPTSLAIGVVRARPQPPRPEPGLWSSGQLGGRGQSCGAGWQCLGCMQPAASLLSGTAWCHWCALELWHCCQCNRSHPEHNPAVDPAGESLGAASPAPCENLKSDLASPWSMAQVSPGSPDLKLEKLSDKEEHSAQVPLEPSPPCGCSSPVATTLLFVILVTAHCSRGRARCLPALLRFLPPGTSPLSHQFW